MAINVEFKKISRRAIVLNQYLLSGIANGPASIGGPGDGG